MPTIHPNDRARILAGTHYNPHSVLGCLLYTSDAADE